MLNEVYNTRRVTEYQSNGILSLIDKWKDLSEVKIGGS